jgi:hypothetical protein
VALEYIGVGGRIILNWIFKQWDGEAWTGLIWLRWRALVNAEMNLWFHKMWEFLE